MKFIVENWYIILALLVVVIVAGISVYKFLGISSTEQKTRIKALLLLWVIETEKNLGSGTGQLKLLEVYNLFTTKFPIISVFVSFKRFSLWVDEALVQMTILLRDNEKVAAYINNTTEVKTDGQNSK